VTGGYDTFGVQTGLWMGFLKFFFWVLRRIEPEAVGLYRDLGWLMPVEGKDSHAELELLGR